jgi:hypothetical protein
LKPRDGFVILAMAAFGVFRAAAFHPMFRPKYREWLELTPWTIRKPLPLGPIQVVWQDAIVLGIVMLALHGSLLGRVWALWAFFLAYLATLGISFLLTGPWWMAYLVLFGLGVSVRLAFEPFVALSAMIPVYAIAMIGRDMALARFPWPESPILQLLRRQLKANSADKRKSLLGWPNQQLMTSMADHQVRRRHGILAPLLVAWWVFVLASNIPEVGGGKTVFPGLILAYVACFAVIARLVAYVANNRPPISLRGRIATGRWILPGYDRVLIAPLCAAMTALVGVEVAALSPPQYRIVIYPLAMAATLIVALNMGPSMKQWQLTGHHRIVPGGARDPNSAKL